MAQRQSSTNRQVAGSNHWAHLNFSADQLMQYFGNQNFRVWLASIFDFGRAIATRVVPGPRRHSGYRIAGAIGATATIDERF